MIVAFPLVPVPLEGTLTLLFLFVLTQLSVGAGVLYYGATQYFEAWPPWHPQPWVGTAILFISIQSSGIHLFHLVTP